MFLWNNYVPYQIEICYRGIDVLLVLLLWAEISKCLLNGLNQNKDHLSCSFDDATTPLKACGDLAYHVTNNGGMLLLLHLLSDHLYLLPNCT